MPWGEIRFYAHMGTSQNNPSTLKKEEKNNIKVETYSKLAAWCERL